MITQKFESMSSRMPHHSILSSGCSALKPGCLGLALLLAACGGSSTSGSGSSTDMGSGPDGSNSVASDPIGSDTGNQPDTAGGTAGGGGTVEGGNTGGSVNLLAPLPQPPLTPAPGPGSEPQSVSGPVSTVTEYFLVRNPPGRIEPDAHDTISEAEFAAGPLPAVIYTPADVDPNSNQPPFFVGLEDQVILAGDTLELVLQPADPDGGLPGMFPEAIPEGARYIDNFNGTRTLRWRPLQPDVGIQEFTITAVDPVASLYRTERTVRIKVELPADPSTIVNLPPVVNSVRRHTVRVNDPVVIEIKGSDPNGTIPSLWLENPPSGATFNQHYNEEAIKVLRFIPRSTGELAIDVIARDAENPDSFGSRTIVIDVLDDAAFIRQGSRLRDLATARDFLIGYASLLDFYYRPDGAIYGDTAGQEFNFVSTENSLKWDLVNPLPGRYRWAATDNLLSYAQVNGQIVHGHTLVWHRQLPDWIRRSAVADREIHMREYIDRLLTRYGNRIPIWDVVNEALEEDGSFRDSVWHQAMGSDFINIAFRQARQSAPDAVLLYNDYDIAYGGPKVDGLFGLLQSLKDQETPIDGVGFQMHVFAKFNQFDDVAANFQRVADLGLDIYITELDVSLDEDDSEALQADVYSRILSLCLEQPRCKAVQTWGFTDMYSWRRDFTPLLLDEAYQPKPAYAAVQQRLSEN